MAPRRQAMILALWAAAAVVPLCQRSDCPAQPSGNGPPAASVELDEADNAARTHLDTADRFLANGQWDEAIETLRRVMDSGAEKVMRIDGAAGEPNGAPARYVTLRTYCQMRLASLHGEALRLYRSRVDQTAQQWCEQAVAARDVALLEQLVDEFFVSSYADDALWLLGETALEQGRYEAAREYWERISPALRMPAPPSWLAGIPDRFQRHRYSTASNGRPSR